MRENAEKDAIRQRHEAAYRFMTALAGDLRVTKKLFDVCFPTTAKLEGTDQRMARGRETVYHATCVSELRDLAACLIPYQLGDLKVPGN